MLGNAYVIFQMHWNYSMPKASKKPSSVSKNLWKFRNIREKEKQNDLQTAFARQTDKRTAELFNGRSGLLPDCPILDTLTNGINGCNGRCINCAIKTPLRFLLPRFGES